MLQINLQSHMCTVAREDNQRSVCFGEEETSVDNSAPLERLKESKSGGADSSGGEDNSHDPTLSRSDGQPGDICSSDDEETKKHVGGKSRQSSRQDKSCQPLIQEHWACVK